MTDDNLDDVQAPKLIALSERDKVIWNEAIEAAANLVQDEMGYPDDTFWIVEAISKLRK